MNFYLVLEGYQTEKQVYRSWMAHSFPNHNEVFRVEGLQNDNFFIVIGNGYPSYLRRIEAAISDLGKHPTIDHLLVCIDAEEMSFSQKEKEIETIIGEQLESDRYSVIVHDCCIETWFLGNTKVMKRNPTDSELIDFKQFYDVRTLDPEKIPPHREYNTRSQLQYKYLKSMLRERGIRYSKKLPGTVKDPPYFEALINRNRSTQHLSSFGDFIRKFRNLGAAI